MSSLVCLSKHFRTLGHDVCAHAVQRHRRQKWKSRTNDVFRWTGLHTVYLSLDRKNAKDVAALLCFRDAGERGMMGPLHPTLSDGVQRGRGAFMKTVYFHGLSRSNWSKFIADIRAPRKFTMVFYNLCYYFWGQYYCWRETNMLVTIFLFCIRFHCSQLFVATTPYRCSGVPALFNFLSKTCLDAR